MPTRGWCGAGGSQKPADIFCSAVVYIVTKIWIRTYILQWLGMEAKNV